MDDQPPQKSLAFKSDKSDDEGGMSTTNTLSSGGRSTGENTPTGYKTPVKPALKTRTSSMDGDDEGSDDEDVRDKKQKAKKKKKTRTLKWDEAKIQEHDQLRGTRMKIEEPNTPFAHYDSGSETDCSMSSARGMAKHQAPSISWDALTNKLEAHAAVNNAYPPSSPSSHGAASAYSSGGELTDAETEDQKRERQRQELKRLEFQEHRKRHYNEMEVVRRFRRENPDGIPRLNGHGGGGDHGDSDDDDDMDNDGDDESE